MQTSPAIIEVLLLRLDDFRKQSMSPLGTWIPLDIRQAALMQDRIGWKNMLEGLPAKAWTVAQDRHCKMVGATKWTGKQWMKGLLKRMHALAWGQWQQRNNVMYEPDQKKQQEAASLLKSELTKEFSRGPMDLPRRDHNHFATNLATLLSKPILSQQAWLVQVTSARHRQARRRGEAVDIVADDPDRLKILAWCKDKRFL